MSWLLKELVQKEVLQWEESFFSRVVRDDEPHPLEINL